MFKFLRKFMTKKKKSLFNPKLHREHKYATIQAHHSNPELVVVSLWEAEHLVTRRLFDDLNKAYQVGTLWASPELEELCQ